MSKSEKFQFCPVVETEIPLPNAERIRSKEFTERINWPYEYMNVGDSFLLPARYPIKRAYSSLGALKKKGVLANNLTVVTEKQGEFVRVWLTTKEALSKADDLLRIGYHVTPHSNLPDILKHGILPRLGERASLANEKLNRVYLFASLEGAENALSNWLGEEFDEVDLAILAVDITSLEVSSEVDYELITDEVIPVENILAVLKESPGFPVDYEYCSLASIEKYIDNNTASRSPLLDSIDQEV